MKSVLTSEALERAQDDFYYRFKERLENDWEEVGKDTAFKRWLSIWYQIEAIPVFKMSKGNSGVDVHFSWDMKHYYNEEYLIMFKLKYG